MPWRRSAKRKWGPQDVGTVPYHRDLADYWRRASYFCLPIVAMAPLMLLLNTRTPGPLWLDVVVVCVWSGLSFTHGVMWNRYRLRMIEQQGKAWEIETQQTLQAMAESGLYASPMAVLEALRDGPLPPGAKRKEWVEAHNDMRARVQQKIARGELPEWFDEPESG